MNRKFLDNIYEKALDESNDLDVFTLSLPITLIQRVMFAHSEESLKKNHELSTSEVDVMASLYFMDKIQTPTQLYENTIFSSGGMTKVLKKLESKKYIKRIPSKEDKRSVFVTLTQKGEELLLVVLDEMTEVKKSYFEILNQKEKDDLQKILKKLLYNIF